MKFWWQLNKHLRLLTSVIANKQSNKTLITFNVEAQIFFLESERVLFWNLLTFRKKSETDFVSILK